MLGVEAGEQDGAHRKRPERREAWLSPPAPPCHGYGEPEQRGSSQPEWPRPEVEIEPLGERDEGWAVGDPFLRRKEANRLGQPCGPAPPRHGCTRQILRSARCRG